MFLLDYIQNTDVNTKTINRNDARESFFTLFPKKFETCGASDDSSNIKLGVWGQRWNFV